jgi:hypothetical protein
MHLHWTSLLAETVDPTATAALRVAIAALGISIIGTGFAWWSARSSARSARTAYDALDLERARRHDERTPRITLAEGDWQDDQEGVWRTNGGPISYPSVRITVIDQGQPSAIKGLLMDDEPTMDVNLGSIEHGERRFIPYRRTDEDPGGDVRLRITCSAEDDHWSLIREFHVLAPPFVF